MSNVNNPKFKKGLVLKIIIPVLLIFVVVGIWAVKNGQKNTDLEKTSESRITESPKSDIPLIDEPKNIEPEGPTVAPSDTEPRNANNAPAEKPKIALVNNKDFGLHVTEEIDIEKLKSYGLPIVIDFGADSCIPCKEMAPVLRDLNTELKGKAIIKFIDVWKYRDLGEGYPISVIPTQVFIDSNGKPYKPNDPQTMQMSLYSSRASGEHVFTAHHGGMTKEQLLRALKEMGLK